MADLARTFLDESIRLVTAEYLPRIDRCLDQLAEDDVWWRPNEASNSIGNLLLHLRGNLMQWIVGGIGRQPFERDRQTEFDERRRIPVERLRADLRDAVARSADVLRALDPATLLAPYEIAGRATTVMEAIYHVTDHFAMHTGQIVLIAKTRLGEDLKLGRH